MADDMRHFLVMRGRCAKCDGPLRFAYPEHGYSTKDVSTGNTGAAEAPMLFSVWPCESCFGKASEPLEKLRSVLAAVGVDVREA